MQRMKHLIHGEPFGIREHALLRARARHRSRVRTDDVDGTNARETILVKGCNRHMVKSRRNERDVECIQPVAEDFLIIVRGNLLVPTGLDHLIKEVHAGRPNLPMRRRIGEPPFGIRRRAPCLQDTRHIQFHQQLIERLCARARRPLCPAQAFLQQGERRGNPPAHGVDRLLLGDARGIVLALIGIRRDRAPRKIPVLRRRPLPLCANAIRKTVVFKAIHRLLPITRGRKYLRLFLRCAEHGEKSRTQGAEHRLIVPSAPRRAGGGAQKLGERMMRARTFRIQIARDAVVREGQRQQLRIAGHIAHEHGDLTIAVSLFARKTQDVRRRGFRLKTRVRRLHEPQRAVPAR